MGDIINSAMSYERTYKPLFQWIADTFGCGELLCMTTPSLSLKKTYITALKHMAWKSGQSPIQRTHSATTIACNLLLYVYIVFHFSIQ